LLECCGRRTSSAARVTRSVVWRICLNEAHGNRRRPRDEELREFEAPDHFLSGRMAAVAHEREPRDRGSDFSPRLSRIRSTAAARSRCLARKHVPAVEETTIAGRSTSTVRLQEDVWVDERGWLVQRKMKQTSRVSGEELADTLRCSPTTSRSRSSNRARATGWTCPTLVARRSFLAPPRYRHRRRRHVPCPSPPPRWEGEGGEPTTSPRRRLRKRSRGTIQPPPPFAHRAD
jgi:hypothetical protein